MQESSTATVGDLCQRDAISLPVHTPVNEVAEYMRDQQLHAVLVIDERPDADRLLGIITDSDLVSRVVALSRDPGALRAKDIMSTDLVSVREDATLWEATELMREEGVRQVPVLNGKAQLLGLLKLDDVLQVVTAELAELLDGLEGQVPRLY